MTTCYVGFIYIGRTNRALRCLKNKDLKFFSYLFHPHFVFRKETPPTGIPRHYKLICISNDHEWRQSNVSLWFALRLSSHILSLLLLFVFIPTVLAMCFSGYFLKNQNYNIYKMCDLLKRRKKPNKVPSYEYKIRTH